MVTHFNSKEHSNIADEIIDSAVALPLENQELLLMMAKAMQYTHNCISHQGAGRPSSPASETNT